MDKAKEKKIEKLFTKAAAASIDELINGYPSLEELKDKYRFTREFEEKIFKLIEKAK